jgi:hypothetical protein
VVGGLACGALDMRRLDRDRRQHLVARTGLTLGMTDTCRRHQRKLKRDGAGPAKGMKTGHSDIPY